AIGSSKRRCCGSRIASRRKSGLTLSNDGGDWRRLRRFAAEELGDPSRANVAGPEGAPAASSKAAENRERAERKAYALGRTRTMRKLYVGASRRKPHLQVAGDSASDLQWAAAGRRV